MPQVSGSITGQSQGKPSCDSVPENSKKVRGKNPNCRTGARKISPAVFPHKNKKQARVFLTSLHVYLKLTFNPNHREVFIHGKGYFVTKPPKRTEGLGVCISGLGLTRLFSVHPVLSTFFSPNVSSSLLAAPIVSLQLSKEVSAL